jgi:hypothetical protein
VPAGEREQRPYGLDAWRESPYYFTPDTTSRAMCLERDRRSLAKVTGHVIYTVRGATALEMPIVTELGAPQIWRHLERCSH